MICMHNKNQAVKEIYTGSAYSYINVQTLGVVCEEYSTQYIRILNKTVLLKAVVSVKDNTEKVKNLIF